eukprot:9169104-Alexandrium_andersonii.AAC.1
MALQEVSRCSADRITTSSPIQTLCPCKGACRFRSTQSSGLVLRNTFTCPPGPLGAPGVARA